jgi:hypothetical protein
MTNDDAIKIINKLLEGLHKLKKMSDAEEYQVIMPAFYCDALIEAISTLESSSEKSNKSCEDAEQIDYHDDFATALKKINDYEMTRDERVAISILNAYKEGYESAMEDYKQEPCDKALDNEKVLDKIRDEIERLHYHPKLDFIKNDEVVEMALNVIDKQIGAIRNE